jgi:hypothetical protein
VSGKAHFKVSIEPKKNPLLATDLPLHLLSFSASAFLPLPPLLTSSSTFFQLLITSLLSDRMAPQHVEHLKGWMEQMHKLANRPDEDGHGFSHDCFGRSAVVEADADSATFAYTIQKSDCNFSGNFHGGSIATLVDNLTTAALFTRERKSWSEHC